MRLALVVSLMSAVVACSKPGRSLVLVELSAPDDASLAVTEGRVVVASGIHVLGKAHDTFVPGSSLDLGVYVPRDVDGVVDVLACGFAHGSPVAMAAAIMPHVYPGLPAGPFSVKLVAGAPDPRCLPDYDEAADSGASGTSGSGGAGADGGAAGGGSDAEAGARDAAAGAGGGGGAAGGTAGAGGGGGLAGGTAGAGGGGGAAGGTAGGAGGSVAVPSWGAAQVVSNNSALAETAAQVAVGSKGSAVAVFQRGTQVVSNSYDAKTDSWGTPVVIDGRTPNASVPRIVVDKTDTYLAVWQQDPAGAFEGIWASTSADGGAHWSTPMAITTTPAFEPVLAMNADGVAIAAWTESTPNDWRLGTSFRPGPAMAWSTPVVFKANDLETSLRDPAVAVSGKGEAFVLWDQDDKGAADQESVWEMRHTAAGWSAPALFEAYDDAGSFKPSVAANAAGIVVATWIEVGAQALTSETLRARRWAFGGNAFGPPVEVATGVFIDNFQAPALVLDEAGKAVVAWAFSIQSQWQVFAGRTDGTAAVLPDIFRIETDDTAPSDNVNGPATRVTLPALGIDPTGNVTLLWRKRVDLAGGKNRFDAWSRRLAKGAGAWSKATLIESRDIGSVEAPALGVGSDGTAIAVWDYTVEPDLWAAVLR